MATRLEGQRENKRPQATMLWDVSSAAFVTVTGKPQRLDLRGYPTRHGADISATYTSQA
jgi:hypothetical protein